MCPQIDYQSPQHTLGCPREQRPQTEWNFVWPCLLKFSGAHRQREIMGEVPNAFSSHQHSPRTCLRGQFPTPTSLILSKNTLKWQQREVAREYQWIGKAKIPLNLLPSSTPPPAFALTSKVWSWETSVSIRT